MQQQEGLTYSLIPLFILQHKRFVVTLCSVHALLLLLLVMLLLSMVEAPPLQPNTYASAFFFPFKHMLNKKRDMNATFIQDKNDKSIFFLLLLLLSSPRMTNDSQYNRPSSQRINVVNLLVFDYKNCCRKVCLFLVHHHHHHCIIVASCHNIENHFLIVFSLFFFQYTLAVECQATINEGSSFLVLLSHL